MLYCTLLFVPTSPPVSREYLLFRGPQHVNQPSHQNIVEFSLITSSITTYPFWLYQPMFRAGASNPGQSEKGCWDFMQKVCLRSSKRPCSLDGGEASEGILVWDCYCIYSFGLPVLITHTQVLGGARQTRGILGPWAKTVHTNWGSKRKWRIHKYIGGKCISKILTSISLNIRRY